MALLLETDDVEPVAGALSAVPQTTLVLRPFTRRPLFTAAIQQFVSTSCHPMRVETSERTDTPDVVVLDGTTVSVDQLDRPAELGVPVLVVGGIAPATPDATRDIVGWLPEEVDAPTFCRAVLDASRGVVRSVREFEDRGLSPRECEVLRLIADGLTNEEIGSRMFLSINTVKTYVRTSYRKIGVTSRSQAVRWMLTVGTHA
jgi:DNA-binding CsgD family transcriptional regulator